MFPAITSFAVSVENILSIRVFDWEVRRVGDLCMVLMSKNKFSPESQWNCDLHCIIGRLIFKLLIRIIS